MPSFDRTTAKCSGGIPTFSFASSIRSRSTRPASLEENPASATHGEGFFPNQRWAIFWRLSDAEFRRLGPLCGGCKSAQNRSGIRFCWRWGFFRKRCREAILQHLVPADVRELSLYDMDLAKSNCRKFSTGADPVPDVPFQVFFIRGVKDLMAGANMKSNLLPSPTISAIPILTRCWCSSPTTSAFLPMPGAWT